MVSGYDALANVDHQLNNLSRRKSPLSAATSDDIRPQIVGQIIWTWWFRWSNAIAKSVWVIGHFFRILLNIWRFTHTEHRNCRGCHIRRNSKGFSKTRGEWIRNLCGLVVWTLEWLIQTDGRHHQQQPQHQRRRRRSRSTDRWPDRLDTSTAATNPTGNASESIRSVNVRLAFKFHWHFAACWRRSQLLEIWCMFMKINESIRSPIMTNMGWQMCIHYSYQLKADSISWKV